VTRRRITAILLPVLAAIGIVAGTAAAATGHHTTASASSNSATSSHAAKPRPVAKPVVFNCTKAQVKPGSFTLTCADGNDYLSHLSWSSWSASSASGTGTNLVNDCTPYCAAGKFHSYPADVNFWRAMPVPGHPGQRYFSRVTLHFPGARPPVYSHGKLGTGPASWTGVLSSKTALKPTQLN
jgi:hypothetical protein